VAQEYLGSYRLLSVLRIGKTCQIWESINDLRGGRYALKVLLPEFRHNREEVGYLRHEHNVGQKLVHPQVISIYEFGIDHDKVYLAMELYPAPNVKQVIVQGVDQIAPIVNLIIEQAAEGLAYLHNQGWVHRDIKPDNYLMKPNGDIKLIDFALAVPIRRSLLSRLIPRSSKVQGTRSYMSPEQIRGKALDQRADIYSFGCMMHELLGGKAPYTGTSTHDLLMKHLNSPVPPLQAANRNITDQCAGLVRRMLSKTPAGRPKTMEEFLFEFRALEVFKEPPQPAPR
jgi:eukaryotic-like serine/threonine-protein kinase